MNVLGSDVTGSNILEKIFSFYSTVRQRGRGKSDKILMDLRNFGQCMIALEVQKGGYKVLPSSMKATSYGWSEIQVMSVTGELLTLVGIQEMDTDVIMAISLDAMKFYSNGFFKKRIAPDGTEFYTTRATTGFSYLVDISCFGDLVVTKPGICGIMHSISY